MRAGAGRARIRVTVGQCRAVIQRSEAACILFVVMAAVTATPSVAQDLRWIGCYEVERGAWNWTGALQDSSQFEPPEFIRLLEEVAESRRTPNRWLVEPEMVPYRPAPGSWAPVAEDSLSIVWTTGYTGVSMRLAASGDSLVGTMTGVTDERFIGVPHSSAPVVLRPRACNTRPAETARDSSGLSP